MAMYGKAVPATKSVKKDAAKAKITKGKTAKPTPNFSNVYGILAKGKKR